MLSAVIIDDDPKGINVLEKLLNGYLDSVEVVGATSAVADGIDLIRELDPDIIFIDIEMPGMSGFELLEAAGEYNGHVIFCTGHDHYAVKAIRARAHDYLLKPVDLDELKEAVARVLASDRKTNTDKPKRIGRLQIPTSKGIIMVDPLEIIYCTSEGNYTNLYFDDNKTLLVSKTLKGVAEMLPDELFCRIHHSHMVNLNFVKTYLRGAGGEVELTNGKRLPVSVRKKDDFLKRLK